MGAASLAVRGLAAGGARFDRVSGIVAGLLALTRPDAVLYAAAYPAVLALRGEEPWRERLKRVFAYGLNVASVFGSYLVFRRARHRGLGGRVGGDRRSVGAGPAGGPR